MTSLVAGRRDGALLGLPLQHGGAIRPARQPARGPGDGAGGDAGRGGRRSLLAPLGLDWLPFQVVGLGMGYIIAVADFVAGLGGAVVGVPAGPPASLGLIALGGAARRALDRPRPLGRARADRRSASRSGRGTTGPTLLIADTGRLFGIRTDAGRVLRATRATAIAAESWLEDDGDLATQAEAHARGGLRAPQQPDRGRCARPRRRCSTSAPATPPTRAAATAPRRPS